MLRGREMTAMPFGEQCCLQRSLQMCPKEHQKAAWRINQARECDWLVTTKPTRTIERCHGTDHTAEK